MTTTPDLGVQIDSHIDEAEIVDCAKIIARAAIDMANMDK